VHNSLEANEYLVKAKRGVRVWPWGSADAHLPGRFRGGSLLGWRSHSWLLYPLGSCIP